MENSNNHQNPEEEIQEEEVDTHAEDSIDDSDASDYEWERQMQEIWREFDEAHAEANDEDLVEAPVEVVVETVNVKPRLISDEELKFLLTYHIAAKAA